jgi:predicted enzyme related to lactoylglutathione lyase
VSFKLGIVILHVKDFNAARDFYVNTLGLPVVPEMSDDHFVTVQPACETQIGITAEPGIVDGQSSTEIGFEVHDVDMLYQEFQHKGISLLSAPQDFPFGRAFDAQDPDGNKLSLYKLRSN